MVAHVLTALRESDIETVFAAVSPATPKTAAWLETQGVQVIATAGEGYVADLGAALDVVDQPVLTVSADLPLLTAVHVDRLISDYATDSLSVCVPLALAEDVAASVDTTVEYEGKTVVPTGLNVVGRGGDRRVVWNDRRLALNVNRPADRQKADRWLSDSA